MHFLNVDVHFALSALLHFILQLVDFRALAADDDPRARGVDAYDKLVGGALDVDRTHTGGLQPILQLLAELRIFVEKVGVVTVGVPARLPGLVVTQPETVRVCFLPHTDLSLCDRKAADFLRGRKAADPYFFLPFFAGTFLPARAFFTRRPTPRTPFCASASARFAAWRSAAAM